MSKADNNEHKELRDFLAKQKAGKNEPADDFEKEALEGFAMLENDEEIMNLKSELDKKIYGEVLTEKKRSKNTYWYAAAGLLLIIGFSVYFVRNNEAVKENNLAISRTDEQKGNDLQEVITNQNAKNKVMEVGPPPEAAQAAEPVKREKSAEKTIAKPDRSGPGSAAEQTKDDAMGAGLAMADANTAVNTINTAPVEMDEDRFVKEKPTAKKAEEPALAMQEQEAMAYTARDEKADKKNRKQSAEGSSQSAVGSQQSAVGSSQSAEGSQQSVGGRPQSAGGGSQSAGGRPQSAVGSSQSAPTPGVSGGAVQPVFMYRGGDEALNGDLKKMLSKKDIKQKFDASLYINEKGKVEKVLFINPYALTVVQQQTATEVLKKLQKFYMTVNGVEMRISDKVVIEYKVVFRP